MFWLKMAFGSNCGEKKLEFFHQKSALPMIFFKILQKARISRIFQIRAFWKTERAKPSQAFWPKAWAKTKPNRGEPRLGSNTRKLLPALSEIVCEKSNKQLWLKIRADTPFMRIDGGNCKINRISFITVR